MAARLREIPLDDGRWDWGGVGHVPAEHLGRACVAFGDAFGVPTVRDVDLREGAVEIELAVSRERSFHGLVWHLVDEAAYESFFVRPHQVGNPDAVQYTPVWNDVSAWQLYHGAGFWAPIAFPLEKWFTLRVAFSGGRGEVFVGDSPAPALAIDGLKLGQTSGRIGILVGGPGLRVARFGYATEAELASSPPSPAERPSGTIARWDVSDPFPEQLLADALVLEDRFAAQRAWTTLEAEPSGLVNLARAAGVDGERNTVLARATVHAERAETRRLAFGFSDRAVVFLNGLAVYRGDDSYRSRDYRFLGSIGLWDALYLPLEQGPNELVVAVSEDFGGWGVMARLD